MAKGKRKHKKKRANSSRPSRPSSPSTPGGPSRGDGGATSSPRSSRSGGGSLWGAGTLIAAIAFGAFILFSVRGGPEPVLPELSLGSMEPQVREAIVEHIAAVSEGPSAENFGALGELLQAHNLDEEASVCYEQAVTLEDDFRWRYLNAHALRALHPERALDEARRAAALNPGYSPAQVVIGQLLEEQGLIEEAQRAYSEAMATDPTSATAVFGYGRMLLSLGESESALTHLEHALELAPNTGEIRSSLAQVYRQLGRREEAAVQARLAAESRDSIGIEDPVHYRMRQRSLSSITMLQRALQARSEGHFAEAESLLRQLTTLRPDDANIHTELGDTFALVERSEDARVAYERALELAPESPAAHYGLANALNIAGDYEGAESHYRRAMAERAEHVPTLLNLGSLLVFRERFEEAETVFREALTVEPDAFGPNRQLGQLLLRRRRIEEAIEHLNLALEKEPKSGPVHLQVAFAYAAIGDMGNTRFHAKQAQDAGQSLPDPMQRLVDNQP